LIDVMQNSSYGFVRPCQVFNQKNVSSCLKISSISEAGRLFLS